MPLFETLLTLMLVAIIFLQFSRKLQAPYPTMLAIAGMLVAALPWAPDVALSEAALGSIAKRPGRPAEILREVYEAERDIARDGKHPHEVSRLDAYRRDAVDAKRSRLLELRRDVEIDDDTFHVLQQELDWAELSAAKPQDQEPLEG